jgi:hypothetical protein
MGGRTLTNNFSPQSTIGCFSEHFMLAASMPRTKLSIFSITLCSDLQKLIPLETIDQREA